MTTAKPQQTPKLQFLPHANTSPPNAKLKPSESKTRSEPLAIRALAIGPSRSIPPLHIRTLSPSPTPEPFAASQAIAVLPPFPRRGKLVAGSQSPPARTRPALGSGIRFTARMASVAFTEALKTDPKEPSPRHSAHSGQTTRWGMTTRSLARLTWLP